MNDTLNINPRVVSIPAEQFEQGGAGKTDKQNFNAFINPKGNSPVGENNGGMRVFASMQSGKETVVVYIPDKDGLKDKERRDREQGKGVNLEALTELRQNNPIRAFRVSEDGSSKEIKLSSQNAGGNSHGSDTVRFKIDENVGGLPKGTEFFARDRVDQFFYQGDRDDQAAAYIKPPKGMSAPQDVKVTVYQREEEKLEKKKP